MAKHMINDKCIFCDHCITVCPADALVKGYPIYYIDQERCEQCGECFGVCSHNAVDVIESAK